MGLSEMDICKIVGQILMNPIWLLFLYVRYGIIRIDNIVDGSCAYQKGHSVSVWYKMFWYMNITACVSHGPGIYKQLSKHIMWGLTF